MINLPKIKSFPYPKLTRLNILFTVILLILSLSVGLLIFFYSQGLRVKINDQSLILYATSESNIVNEAGLKFRDLEISINLEKEKSESLEDGIKRIQKRLEDLDDELTSKKLEVTDLETENTELKSKISENKIKVEQEKADAVVTQNNRLSNLDNNLFLNDRVQDKKAIAKSLGKTCVASNYKNSGFYTCSEGLISVNCNNLGSGSFYTASCNGVDLGFLMCSISTVGIYTNTSCY